MAENMVLLDESQRDDNLLSDPEERRVWYAALDSFRYVTMRTTCLSDSTTGLRCQNKACCVCR